MTIPFDADWRRLCTASDTPAALARWVIAEPTLAGRDLDGLRCLARSHNPAVSDPVLAALLRLTGGDRLARRVIVEALMGRLVPIAGVLARRNGDPYDDVLAELAGWAWELAATISSDRWSTQLASNLARLARRRYLTERRHSAVPHLGHHQPPDRSGDGFDHPLGAHDVEALLSRAVTAGTITPTGARILTAPGRHRRHRPDHRQAPRAQPGRDQKGTCTGRRPTPHLATGSHPTSRLTPSGAAKTSPIAHGRPRRRPPQGWALRSSWTRPWPGACLRHKGRCEPPLRFGTHLADATPCAELRPRPLSVPNNPQHQPERNQHMNTTTITGRLTADPEIRFATTGTPVATLRVANNDRDDHPVFVTVTAFATLAQVVADHLTKGRKVGVTGRLHLEEWETDGQKRSKLTVIANQIDFLDAPPVADGAHAGITPITAGAEEPF